MDFGRPPGDNASVIRSWRWVVPLLLAVLVGGSVYFDRQAARGDREIGVYVLGGQRMAAGEEVYRRGSEAKPFTYPPFAAVPFVAFVTLPAAWHPTVWFAVNLLILVAVCRWLHGWARRDHEGLGRPRMWWFWVVTGVFGGRHVVSVFTNQSHDLTVLAALTLGAAAWCRRGAVARTLAGAWVGLGAATKATPLVFLGLFALRRRWSALGACVAVAVGATLWPDYAFPRAPTAVVAADLQYPEERLGAGAWWRQWYDVNLAGLRVGGTADARGAWNAHSVLNQSLSGALHRWFTPVEVPDAGFVVGNRGDVLVVALPAERVRAVTIVAALFVLGFLAAAARFGARAVSLAEGRGAEAQRTVGLGEFAAFACGMLLLSPQSSKSHFCVWLLPVAFVVDHLLRRRFDGVAVCLFVAALALGVLSKGLLGREAANLALAYGSVAGSTLLLLLATVRCLQRP